MINRVSVAIVFIIMIAHALFTYHHNNYKQTHKTASIKQNVKVIISVLFSSAMNLQMCVAVSPLCYTLNA